MTRHGEGKFWRVVVEEERWKQILHSHFEPLYGEKLAYVITALARKLMGTALGASACRV